MRQMLSQRASIHVDVLQKGLHEIHVSAHDFSLNSSAKKMVAVEMPVDMYIDNC